MNNLPFFRQIEDKELRGDRFDSVSEIHRGKKGTVISDNDQVNPFPINNWVLGIDKSPPEELNIFCMCAVRPSLGRFSIDERNFRFGEYALIFTKPQEFINRISNQRKLQNIKGYANLVEYINDDYTGDLGPFRKRKMFDYQSEWRLVFYNGPGKERKFYIGSIKDICIVVKSIEVNRYLSRLLPSDSV